MRANVLDLVEKGRVRGGRYASDRGDRNGAFILRHPAGSHLWVVASDGAGWSEAGLTGVPFEHVSVSLADRCPTWDEMCWVKGLFWEPSEVVVQYHPPEAEYVNHHPYCLHLWRPVGAEVPLPPGACVGPAKGAVV